MSDQLQIDVDASALLRAFDRLGEAASRLLFEAARESAESLRTEARTRLSRQTHGTGQTAEAITVEKIPSGYKVFVGPMGSRPENLPIWLEYGTRKMDPKPYLYAAAKLEEGRYLRHVGEALRDAVEEASK